MSHDEPPNEALGITPVSGWRRFVVWLVVAAIGIAFWLVFLRWFFKPLDDALADCARPTFTPPIQAVFYFPPEPPP